MLVPPWEHFRTFGKNGVFWSFLGFSRKWAFLAILANLAFLANFGGFWQNPRFCTFPDPRESGAPTGIHPDHDPDIRSCHNPDMSIHGFDIMNDATPPGPRRKFDHPPVQIFGVGHLSSIIVSMLRPRWSRWHTIENEPRIFFMLSA